MVEEELDSSYLSEKSMEDFKNVLPQQKQEDIEERKITTAAFRILRFIDRKDGVIAKKTKDIEFNMWERTATEELIELGWLEKKEGIWRSPSYRASYLILSLFVGGFMVHILSTQVPLWFLGVIGSTVLIGVMGAFAALLLLVSSGSFYTHPFENIRLSKKTKKLLKRWHHILGGPAKNFGSLVERDEERIREKVFRRLHS